VIATVAVLAQEVVDNTVADRSWWQQTLEIVIRIGVVAGALVGLIRFAAWKSPWNPFRWLRWIGHRIGIAFPIAHWLRGFIVEAIEPQIAEVRAQVVETQTRVAISERKIRAELADHTDAEQMFAAQLVRAVVAAGAARQADVREHPGRLSDGADPGGSPPEV
jgi:hypothetical protein